MYTVYILPPERSKCSLGFFGVLGQLFGRLSINEATGQVGGYGFGQVLTKRTFSVNIPPSVIVYGTM